MNSDLGILKGPSFLALMVSEDDIEHYLIISQSDVAILGFRQREGKVMYSQWVFLVNFVPRC